MREENKEILEKYFLEKKCDELKCVSWHHIDSYDYAFDVCLKRFLANLRPVHVTVPSSISPNGELRMWIEEAEALKPYHEGVNLSTRENRLMPGECRQRALTYCGKLMVTVAIQSGNNPSERVSLEIPGIPVMVMSKLCHLRGMKGEELVQSQENSSEFGGYFIVHGIEKVIRMLIVAKRNYPIAILRPSYVNRGRYYTGFAVQMRCVREDSFAQSVTLHYLSNGEVTLRILYRKQEFLIPVVLIMKALIDCTDEEIYVKIVKNASEGTDIGDRAELLIAEARKYHTLYYRTDFLAYIGSRFRTIIDVAEHFTDAEVGEIFLRDHILVHLIDNQSKFDVLCVMMEKLYALVSGLISQDNLDSTMNQEVLLPGHVYMNLLVEKLQDILVAVKTRVNKDSKSISRMKDLSFIKKLLTGQALAVGKKMEYFLATGTLVSQSNLDLQQSTGYAIVADKLNHIRYLSHFRSIHRGQYFAEMKTTVVRKLLPESWGFICPVHTPDGSPCGLLNHISQSCAPVTRESLSSINSGKFLQVLIEMGLFTVASTSIVHSFDKNYLPVLLDGKLIGYVPDKLAKHFVDSLRGAKVNGPSVVPENLEIGYVPKSIYEKAKQFPGIFLSTGPGRFLRPVQNLIHNKVEWIGPFEQVYMSIAASSADIRSDTTHQEIKSSNILSIIAATIPFLEYNQSPRNMYQCQMAKQTMGTPCHNFPYRYDNKLYRLIYPQMPIVKTEAYEKYSFDMFPSGTNAVVAVISYTGYDMEDAMILNKSSYERGFGHGCIYKTYMRSPAEEGAKLSSSASTGKGKAGERFRLIDPVNYPDDSKFDLKGNLGKDGLPTVGTKMSYRDPELCLVDTVKGDTVYYSYKDNESAYVEEVKLIANDAGSSSPDILYKMRYPRNPVIGDKFSSRHGQKGVLSFLWPQVDMPFSESGITPDVIINPHAFPSRMTIGMLIESLAGKSGAAHGNYQTIEPFEKYPEEGDVVKYFGQELVKAGYNYYGTEQLYSGIFGTPMKAEIYMGLVYYQRLRHMVSDKSQARATGPIDVLTHQPVKGRKKQGGIRFGEMERDALLGHGAAFCIHDRLLLSSDYSEGYVCNKCGSVLSCFRRVDVQLQGSVFDKDAERLKTEQEMICKMCGTSSKCNKVSMPYVFRLLANELAAMNIRLKVKST